jgi:hypothetical protein
MILPYDDLFDFVKDLLHLQPVLGYDSESMCYLL